MIVFLSASLKSTLMIELNNDRKLQEHNVSYSG